MTRARVLLRRALLGAAALLAAALVWALLALLAVADDLQSAEQALGAAAAARDLPTLTEHLDEAQGSLTRADDGLSTAGPVVASWLPVVGRTPYAARGTVRAALAATTGALDVLHAAGTDGELVRDGRVDLVRLDRLSQALTAAARRTQDPVADLEDASTSLVPGRVARGVQQARARLHDLPERLAAAAGVAHAAQRLLGADEPRRLLFVLENNAELRGTGGLVSVFSQVTAQDGRLAFGAFTDVDSVAVDRTLAQPVPAPEDYVSLWGPFKANTTLWKNVNMSPDVPTSSGVLASLAERSLGARPDAIVWLDVRTIAAVIGATGDATLPDGTVLTEQSTVPALLSQAYASTADNERDQGLRRLRLRAAADVVVQRLTSGTPTPGLLVPALARAAAGRHLALWADRADEQAALRRAGLAGALDGDDDVDLVSPAVNNFGDGMSFGNKLDFYSRRQVTVQVTLSPDEAVVEQELALRNTAPDSGLPTYVAGRARPGTTNNHIAIALPERARDVELVREQQDLGARQQPQARHAVVVDGASLAPGTTATWRLRYRLPLEDADYALRLVPQPLAVDAGLLVRVEPAEGTHLVPGPGTPELDGSGAVVLSGPFDRVRHLRVHASRGSLPERVVDRLRRFWNEPVPLP